MKNIWLILGVLVPFYVVRFSVFGIPTNLWEASAVLVCIVSYIYHREVLKNGLSIAQRSGWLLMIHLGALVGIIVSNQLIDALGVWKSFFFIPTGVMICLSGKQNWIFAFTRGLVYSGVLIGIITTGQAILGFQTEIRPTAWYLYGLDPNLASGGFANYIGMYLTPLIFMSLINGVLQFKRRVNQLIRGVLVTGVLASQSYVSLFVLLIGGIAFLIREFYKNGSKFEPRYWSYMCIGVVVILGFILWQGETEKFQLLWDFSRRNSFSARMQIWHASLLMIVSHPIWGIGLVDFERIYQQVIPHLYFPPHEWLVPHSHNIYLTFWLQTGIVGIVGVLFVVLRSGHNFVTENWRLSLPMISILIYGLLDTPFWKNDLAVIFLVSATLLYQKTPYQR